MWVRKDAATIATEQARREAKRRSRFAMPAAVMVAVLAAVLYLDGASAHDVLPAILSALGLGLVAFLLVRRVELLMFGTQGTWRNPDLLICALCKRRVSAGMGSHCECGGDLEPLNHWSWLPDNPSTPASTRSK